MTNPARRRKWRNRRYLLWPFAALLIALAGVMWRWTASRDALSGLDAEDHDHALFSDDTPPTARTETKESLAEQFRQLDARLAADPNNPAALVAKIHLGLEHAPSTAAAECERLLERSPNNYFALHHAAMAYLALTNLDRALLYAARALQVRDTPEARWVAGNVFYSKGDFTNALHHYRLVLAHDPNDQAARAAVERAEYAWAARRRSTP